MIFIFCISVGISCIGQKNESAKEVLILMGTRFEITAIADTKSNAEYAVKSGIQEIKRIEELISSWKETSQTSEINRNSGLHPVKVDKELLELIHRSLKVSKITDGAFDISFASMDRIYRFDKNEHSLPTDNERMAAVEKIDYKAIELDHDKQTVLLKKKGMKIGFGGIGKGYAANMAKKIMIQSEGVIGGVVNAAGDLVVWGENENEERWPIQISDPKDLNRTLGWLEVQDASVVTSGDYEKYFNNNGLRYAHIINPETGLPTTGIKSATIVCSDGELGDALATSLFVLGPKKGMELINRLKNFEALVITDADEVLTSKNLKLNKY